MHCPWYMPGDINKNNTLWDRQNERKNDGQTAYYCRSTEGFKPYRVYIRIYVVLRFQQVLRLDSTMKIPRISGTDFCTRDTGKIFIFFFSFMQ